MSGDGYGHDYGACWPGRVVPVTAQPAEGLREIARRNQFADAVARHQAPEHHAPDSPLATQVGGDHYRRLAIQPAEFSERNGLGFLEGCVVKRVVRHSRGGKGRQDLEKAIHELQLILAMHYSEPPYERP